MCGITGYLTSNVQPEADMLRCVSAMALAVAHRGPDDAGAWADADAGVALGHRRLAILDLSAAGHQPMASASGRYVMAYNGEIYNHQDLRTELQALGAAPDWHGHSDTETLLAACEHWGLETTLKKAVGMFAIALWDMRTRTLSLVRDRFGEKPLYYGWAGGVLMFGSELKALRAYPGFANPVCRQALAQYMRFMAVPAPRSIYQGIYKLEPGCLLTVGGTPPATAPRQPLRPGDAYQTVTLSRWWALADVVQAGAQDPFTNESDALAALDMQLQETIRLQSLADVPLGAFLSGGVDSSLIVALMQQQARRNGSGPVQTFTVGFEEAGFDESPHARAVAKHLETDHNELFVTAIEAQAVISQLPAMYDEPFADSSQIPTHLVCRAARQKVTVALSGDAGDELFGGYNRYLWSPRIWRKLAWLPFTARRTLGRGIASVPVETWDALSHPINLVLPGARGISGVGNKAHKLAARLSNVRNQSDLNLSLVSTWQDTAEVVKAESMSVLVEPASVLADPLPKRGTEKCELEMMYRDSMSYLPDDILCKVDRAAMATSLETRVPFLDHRVAELAWRLPLDMKIRGQEGKWALRQVLYKHVPRELIERPKSGFAIPIGKWLRGPLREWAEALLDAKRLEAEGYFHPGPIRQRWFEHISGHIDHTASLWAVLMFQAWLQENRTPP